MLDVFKSSAFDVVSLTTSINLLPHIPQRVGQMGLFAASGITTTTAVIEYNQGKLSLVARQERGSTSNVLGSVKRVVKSFVVPHAPLWNVIKADDVQGVRAFGSESQLQTVAKLVNNRLAEMKASHEATHEFHRLGAISGKVYDADGTTLIFDYFSEFNIAEPSQVFDLTASTPPVKESCLDVIRGIEDQLGNQTYGHIHAVCSDAFWDAFINNAEVKAAYERWNDGQFLRTNERQNFEFGGIVWENYRGKVGSVPFVAANTARFFPVGVPDMFQAVAAPADMIETVNTMGKPFYASQVRLPHNKGIELHTQSNVLMIPTRPGALYKGTFV